MRCRELILAAVLGSSATLAGALPMNEMAFPGDSGTTVVDGLGARTASRWDGAPGAVPRRSEFADSAACCSIEDLLSIIGASPWSADAVYDGDTPLSAFVIAPATPELQLISEPASAALTLLGLAALGLLRILRGLRA